MWKYLVLSALGFAWVLVLLPPLFSGRGRGSRDTMSTFTRQLTVLGGGRPSAPRVVPGRTGPTSTGPVPATLAAPITARASRQREIRRRRRTVLYGLLGAVVASLFGAVFIGGRFVITHFVVDAALIFYVVWLLQLQQNTREANTKVTYLDTGSLSPVEHMARQAASNQ